MHNGPHDHERREASAHQQGENYEDTSGAYEQPHTHGRAPRITDPTPQYVYWIRRAVALAILVAAIALVVWGVKAIASSFNNSDTPQSKTTPKASPENKSGNDSEHEATVDPTDRGKSPKACDPSAVSLTLTSPQTSASAGSVFAMTLDVKNDGEESCIIDVSPPQTVVTVNSGKDRIWSSADCDESGTQALFMEKSAATTSEINWDVKRSSEACESNLPSVKAGTYRAVAHYGAASSEELVFQVK